MPGLKNPNGQTGKKIETDKVGKILKIESLNVQLKFQDDS